LLAPVDTIDINNKNFFKRYGSVFDNWSRLHLNYAFYELDNLLNKNYQTIQKIDSVQMTFVSNRFSYEFTSEETNMDNPLALFLKHKPFYLILVLLLFHFLILLPYFIEPVSGIYIPKNPKAPRKGGGLKI
jgi:hypothetical protein